MPLLLIHGTADEINSFDDGELEGNLQYWIRRNGCALSATRTWLPDTTKDGTRTRADSFGGCARGADVVMYAVEGGGHHWPGGDEKLSARNGREIRDFDAAIVIWEFFNKHPMPATE
jgi:polyhydroxybutyrate depolymerase